jgi:hypothetical protein
MALKTTAEIIFFSQPVKVSMWTWNEALCQKTVPVVRITSLKVGFVLHQ